MLMLIVDSLVPLKPFAKYNSIYSDRPAYIKNIINVCKRLLIELMEAITKNDKEIKKFNKSSKSRRVRKSIIPGNTGSFWKAVKISKDMKRFIPQALMVSI